MFFWRSAAGLLVVFMLVRTRAVDDWTRSRCLMITMILLLDMFVCVCVCVGSVANFSEELSVSIFSVV